MDNGLARFQRRMRSLPDAARKAVVPALTTGAEEIAGLQRQLAPVDEGDLRDSIHVTRPGETTPAYSQPGGSRVAGPLEAVVTAGNADVRYPHLQEYGTTDAPAQPYFWPGYRLGRKRATARIKRAVAKAVREAWKE